MTTPATRETAGLKLAAIALGVVATLGTGFMAWGGMDQRVQTIEGARDRKPDREALREQISQFRDEARARFDRLERILLERDRR